MLMALPADAICHWERLLCMCQDVMFVESFLIWCHAKDAGSPTCWRAEATPLALLLV